MKRFFVLASACVLLSSGLDAATVTGKVGFVTKRGQRPIVAETLISLEAQNRSQKKPPAAFTMTTRSKTFLPHVMAVPAGSTISFPNEDPISHNLFSLSPGHTFDLGLYRRGAGKSQKFEKPGVVNIYCNVHPNMSAVVHVMSTPYYGFADASGAWSIDVPPGRYTLTAWNEQTGSTTSVVEVKADGKVEGQTTLTLDGRTFRALQHNNKYGKPYRAPRDY